MPPDEPDEPTPEPKPEPEVVAERSDVDELLTRIGYEPLVSRVVSTKLWNAEPDRFSDEEYQRSCLIDRGGDTPVKERCSLPVLEPDGAINETALVAAAKQLPQTRVTSAQKQAAARLLIRYYRRTEIDPPAPIRMLASS